ncbi:MAG: tRNA lysidine(34) synthetase TilS [Planctomycetaceae bacterium]|jgi:tRNA(Ile)-lysidine synthase|nr:tRNA lysidine(34) synthetase TilS [Planctomycetaceae bacterium]
MQTIHNQISRQFQTRLTEIHAFEHGIVLAVSGGADSVAMFSIVTEFASRQNQKSRVLVAHLNHALRGKESDDDEQFVIELAKKHGLRVITGRLTDRETERDESGSLESTLRQHRYNFLQKTAEQNAFRYVLTAHTANDQVETVLHRILRGTGLRGLGGIEEYRKLSDAVVVVRPMLEITTSEIREYLKTVNQTYRTDSSNSGDKFTRNKIRGTLLPLIREMINPQTDHAILRLTKQAQQAESIIETLIDKLEEKCIVYEQKQTKIKIENLTQEPEELIIRLFQRIWQKRNWQERQMGTQQWQSLKNFVKQKEKNKRIILPNQVAVEYCGDMLMIEKK